MVTGSCGGTVWGGSYRKKHGMEMFGIRSGSLIDNKEVWGGFGEGFGVLGGSLLGSQCLGSPIERVVGPGRV